MFQSSCESWKRTKLESLNVVIENTVFGRVFLNALLASV